MIKGVFSYGKSMLYLIILVERRFILYEFRKQGCEFFGNSISPKKQNKTKSTEPEHSLVVLNKNFS